MEKLNVNINSLNINIDSLTPAKYYCNECKDNGWIEIGQRVDRCPNCFYEVVEKVVSGNCGIRYKKCTFENFTTISGKESKGTIEIPKDLNDSSFVLWGPTGSGKTHIAVSMYRSDLLKGRNSIWITERELLTQSQQHLNNQINSGSWATTLFDKPEGFDSIYCDDIGKVNITDSRRSVIYDFIETVYKNNIKIVITSNTLDLVAWLGENIGNATFSRVKGMCRIIKFISHDRR